MYTSTRFKSHLHQRTASLKAQGIPLMSLQGDSVLGFVPSSASSLNRQSFRSVSKNLLVCCGSSVLLSDSSCCVRRCCCRPTQSSNRQRLKSSIPSRSALLLPIRPLFPPP